MRRILVLFLALGAALAQEDPKARARELELEAEKALEEGRRADALRLLNEAADKRAGKTPAPPGQLAANDLAEMEAALGKGDAAAALAAGKRARDALAEWAKELETRERRPPVEETPVEQRLERLAKQIEELAKRRGR